MYIRGSFTVDQKDYIDIGAWVVGREDIWISTHVFISPAFQHVGYKEEHVEFLLLDWRKITSYTYHDV